MLTNSTVSIDKCPSALDDSTPLVVKHSELCCGGGGGGLEGCYGTPWIKYKVMFCILGKYIDINIIKSTLMFGKFIQGRSTIIVK